MWRKWIGDAIGITLLGGPFLIAPFILALMTENDDRAIIFVLGFAGLGTVALLISVWRRTPTWHLLAMPGLAAVVLAGGTHWARARHDSDDVGLTGTARFLARKLHLWGWYWSGLGAALVLLFGFTALVWATSARSGRPLRTGFWRAGSLAIALFGTACVFYFMRDDSWLLERISPIGGVVAVAALSIFIAGGSDQTDDESRARVLLACLYAIASVVCACLLRVTFELTDLWAYSEKWSDIGEMAERNIDAARRLAKHAFPLVIPLVLASALVLRRWPFWRSRMLRVSIAAMLAPLVVLACVRIRALQLNGEIMSLDFPMPAGFTALEARIDQRCDVEPEDIVFFPVSFDDATTGEVRKQIHSGSVIAIDAKMPFERARRLLEAMSDNCNVQWLVWNDGHSRCATLRNLPVCGKYDIDFLDVTVGPAGLDVARVNQHGIVLEPAKKQSASELAKKVDELVQPDAIEDSHLVRGAVLRAPETMPLGDAMGAYSAVVHAQHLVGDGMRYGKDEVLPFFDVWFAPLGDAKETANDLADTQALAAPLDEALTLCSAKLCSAGAWKTLETKNALRHASAERSDAVEDAFLVLALDPNGLEGSGLDASIVADAKKLVQPFKTLAADAKVPAPIANVVSQNEGAVRMCVAELDLRRTIRHDTWHFTVTIAMSGLAAEMQGEGDISRGTARNCIENAFRAMRFPPQPRPIETRWTLEIIDESTNAFGFRRGPGSRVRPLVTLRQGQTQVSGKLPPEVIQRIVRQNFGRFRLCYEEHVKPPVDGRAIVRFVIDGKGEVSSAIDAGSDLDKRSVDCIVRGFTNLSFPEPEDKKPVTVTYPMVFVKGD